jgi:hypothetical protein
MISATGKTFASLVLPPLLGAFAGAAYALVCGGVHWVIWGGEDRVLHFAGMCVAVGALLGLVVAVCRVVSFAGAVSARPEAVPEPGQSPARSRLSTSWPAGGSSRLDGYALGAGGTTKVQSNEGIYLG